MENIKAQQQKVFGCAVQLEASGGPMRKSTGVWRREKRQQATQKKGLEKFAPATRKLLGIGKLHYFYMLNNIQELSRVGGAVVVLVGARKVKTRRKPQKKFEQLTEQPIHTKKRKTLIPNGKTCLLGSAERLEEEFYLVISQNRLRQEL